ncbi:MAG TPA: DUF362 domain-containing protein [Polyangia bacterium]|nr:DUF362 domain-containing protein [Polyangia bacterium]
MKRRPVLKAGVAIAGMAGVGYALRRSIVARLDRWTRRADFAATPPLLPHDPVRDRSRVAVARGGAPADNIDAALAKVGGIERVVGERDVVLIKVSAQWWNQGMTNVAAARRLIERVVGRPGFAGEVIVFENTHFRLPDGSGLSRAWTRPSDRNVDVPGWTRLGDLIPHFAGLKAPVSFVGLIDGGASALAGDHWFDSRHEHGVYGGDGRGPIADGEERDGYHWDFTETFSLPRSLVDSARTPLTWPVFTSPRSGLVVDLRRGIFQKDASGRRAPVADRKLTWINMTTCNEHAATGITAACKSPMGLVDMSAGALGTDPRGRGYQSLHYFGYPNASWRMAGPLADFTMKVRAPDLYLTVAEWISITPPGPWDPERQDIRLEEASARRARTVVAGTDPVAIDTYCARNLLMPASGARRDMWDLDDPSSFAVKFLRYYRQVAGRGTMDPSLIEVV